MNMRRRRSAGASASFDGDGRRDVARGRTRPKNRRSGDKIQ
jgi:hypothetical protein